MKTIENPTIPPAAEEILQRIADLSNDALNALRLATIHTFRLLWENEDQREELLAKMGVLGGGLFAQHYDTVLYLLRSYARSCAAECGATEGEVSEVIADPLVWLMTNQEHPLAVAILTLLPPSDFTPPVAYTTAEDGTITIDP